MKGLTTLAFFALLYLLLMFAFKEIAGEPRGVQDNNVGQTTSSSAQAEKDDESVSGTEGVLPASPPQQANFGPVEGAKHLAKEKDQADVKKAREAGDNGRNETNPLADLFQITDPPMRSTLGAIYGAYRGNDQCSRKAFCMMGNYMKDMPGRDLIFLIMGNYIPSEYSLYYEIFKVAVMYGQNCDVYVCIPNPDQNDAASAARPAPGIPTPAQQQNSGPR